MLWRASSSVRRGFLWGMLSFGAIGEAWVTCLGVLVSVGVGFVLVGQGEREDLLAERFARLGKKGPRFALGFARAGWA